LVTVGSEAACFFAFFTARAPLVTLLALVLLALVLLVGVRLPAFAFDRFFAAMSILIIRYRDR
jgi:hypothetical protein